MVSRTMAIVALTSTLSGCAGRASGDIADELGTGGCLVVKQAPSGEYAHAQLAKFAGNQLGVCELLVAAWNRDPELTGTQARFRCQCPKD